MYVFIYFVVGGADVSASRGGIWMISFIYDVTGFSTLDL